MILSSEKKKEKKQEKTPTAPNGRCGLGTVTYWSSWCSLCAASPGPMLTLCSAFSRYPSSRK